MRDILASFIVGLTAAALVCAAGDTQSITLDHKLQIPGATLKSGQYTFSIEDRLQDRAIIRITDEKRGTHELLLAVPNDKLSGANQNRLVLFQTSDPDKQILQGWMCPSCQSALELVYPKAEAVKITGESAKPVMAVDPTYDKLPKNLTADDMKVVTLWLLSPKEITPDQKGKGVEAAKMADLHPKSDKQIANSATAPAPAGGPVTDAPVAAASAQPESLPTTTSTASAATSASSASPMPNEPLPAPAVATAPSPAPVATPAPVPAGTPSAVVSSPVAAPASSAPPAPVEVASNSPGRNHRKMPHTASNTYTFGLSGLLLLAGGLGLRLHRRPWFAASSR